MGGILPGSVAAVFRPLSVGPGGGTGGLGTAVAIRALPATGVLTGLAGKAGALRTAPAIFGVSGERVRYTGTMTGNPPSYPAQAGAHGSDATLLARQGAHLTVSTTTTPARWFRLALSRVAGHAWQNAPWSWDGRAS